MSYDRDLWESFSYPDADFSVVALHAALDDKRKAAGLSWSGVAFEVNHRIRRKRAISASSISGLKTKRFGVEGDGVLQMLLWLDRTPESFVPGHPGAKHPDARLPRPEANHTLRFDVQAIFAALDEQREDRDLKWADVSRQIGYFTPNMVARMGGNTRIGFPRVMRLMRWLRAPVAAFTYSAPMSVEKLPR